MIVFDRINAFNFIMFRYVISKKMKRGGGYISPKTAKTRTIRALASALGLSEKNQEKMMGMVAHPSEYKMGNLPTKDERKQRKQRESDAYLREVQLRQMERKEQFKKMLSSFRSKSGKISKTRRGGKQKRYATRRRVH